MKWRGFPNLSRRPPAPAKDRGPVQRQVRRALTVHDTATTMQLVGWCYRSHGRDRRARNNRCRAVRRAAAEIAVRVGRVWPGGNIWRAKDDTLTR